MPAIVALLIPLIPTLIDSVKTLIDIVAGNDETPEELKAHLEKISADLQEINTRIQNAPMP